MASHATKHWGMLIFSLDVFWWEESTPIYTSAQQKWFVEKDNAAEKEKCDVMKLADLFQGNLVLLHEYSYVRWFGRNNENHYALPSILVSHIHFCGLLFICG